jgi:hypothetical protein
MGFVSNLATERTSAGEHPYFRYDTAVPGNGNAGHNYGITLSDADKWALLEYMKTF